MNLDDFDLVIFDVDGALVEPKGGTPFRKEPSDWQLLPGRKEACHALLAAGKKIALATNQGGAAFGYFEPRAMQEQIDSLAREVGADAWLVSFTHPEGTVPYLTRECFDRKPGPGMLLRLMAACEARPGRTLMVGDRSEDRLAAENASCHFRWADAFFAEVAKP